MRKPVSKKAFLVWFDLACDDFMALEKQDMTPAFSAALKADGVKIHETCAETPKLAIQNVFPNRAAGQFEGKTVVGLAPGKARVGRPH